MTKNYIIANTLRALKSAVGLLHKMDSGVADVFDRKKFFELVSIFETYKGIAEEYELDSELFEYVERYGFTRYYEGGESIVAIANDIKAEERRAYSEYALSLI